MKDFLKPTKKKGLLALLLIVFYYVAYFIGNQIGGTIATQFVSLESLMDVLEPMLPTVMSQIGTLMKMVIVLFAVQFIFILALSYLFACLIVHVLRGKK